MATVISPHGIPIMQVYGLTVDHDGPFWINAEDFDPALHQPVEEDEAEAKPNAKAKATSPKPNAKAK